MKLDRQDQDTDVPSTSSHQRRMRGASRAADLPPLGVDSRPTRHISANGCFEQMDVKNTIASIIKSRILQPRITWRQWPDSEKELLWEKLLDYFRFLPSDAYNRLPFYSYV